MHVRAIGLAAGALALCALDLAGAAVTCPKGSLTSADAKVCCPASCTKCGGAGCDKLPGGAAKCCSGNISRSKNICGAPPCVLTKSSPPSSKRCGSDNSGIASSDFKICCAASCTKCGGAGCEKLPGGAAKCCSGNIIGSKRVCGTPPCVLPKSGHPSDKRCGSDHSGIVSSDGKACCAASCKTCGCDGTDRDKLCCPAEISRRDKGCGLPPCVIRGAGGVKCSSNQESCGYTVNNYDTAPSPATTCCAAGQMCFSPSDCSGTCENVRTFCGTDLKCPDGGVPCWWGSDDLLDPTARPRIKSTKCCKKGEFCNAYYYYRSSAFRRCGPTKVCDDLNRRCGFKYGAYYVKEYGIYTQNGNTLPTLCCPRPGMCKIEPQPSKDSETGELWWHMNCVEPKKCPSGQTPCGRRHFNIYAIGDEDSPDTVCCSSSQKCVLEQDIPLDDDRLIFQYTSKCVAK